MNTLNDVILSLYSKLSLNEKIVPVVDTNVELQVKKRKNTPQAF